MKEVALSVVSGINCECKPHTTHTTISKYVKPFELNQSAFPFTASIFAYGQTSSGKTYTMTGVTEYTVADIYDYINKVTKLPSIF